MTTEPTAELEIPSPENPLRDVNYIAEATGYTAATVRVWLREGLLKGRKDAEEWRILQSDFVEFCQQKWGSK